MWIEDLKKLGVNIHVIATGAGAGLQKMLWQTPGCSAYLSGCSFPYDQAETEEILGFTPDKFVCESMAIDLASAAYMKAFKYGGKKPVGIGITASVASEVVHRGDHRYSICVITDDKVLTQNVILKKGVGFDQRIYDGNHVDQTAFMLMFEALDLGTPRPSKGIDASGLARSLFMKHPFFTVDGRRHEAIANANANANDYALMPGAFNPPHAGHFSMAQAFERKNQERVVFEVTVNPPHKAELTVQDLLKRAKLLQGHNRLFTTDIPMYIQKARAYPGMPLILGADAMVRMLDPKWGVDVSSMLHEFHNLGTTLHVAERLIDGEEVCFEDIIHDHVLDILDLEHEEERVDMAYQLIQEIPGRWDISSTEIRNKTK